MNNDDLYNILYQIYELSKVNIPYYAYGNNEAAVYMMNMLNNINSIVADLLINIQESEKNNE